MSKEIDKITEKIEKEKMKKKGLLAELNIFKVEILKEKQKKDLKKIDQLRKKLLNDM